MLLKFHSPQICIRVGSIVWDFGLDREREKDQKSWRHSEYDEICIVYFIRNISTRSTRKLCLDLVKSFLDCQWSVLHIKCCAWARLRFGQINHTVRSASIIIQMWMWACGHRLISTRHFNMINSLSLSLSDSYSLTLSPFELRTLLNLLSFKVI